MSANQQLGAMLESMIQYSNSHPSWERSASLLFLLGVIFGCTSVYNRFLFSMGVDVTESLYLLEVLIPSGSVILMMLLRLDRFFGCPINLSRFTDRHTLFSILPSLLFFAIRNTIPSYAMSLSTKGNVRDFIFCSRLLQPILIFVLEGCLTSRRSWKWHVVFLFVTITGISLFLFRTFDPSDTGASVPLMGAMSNPFATIMNLLTAVCSGAFFVAFARNATALQRDQPWIPLQDLIAIHFISSLVFQVLASVFTDTLRNEIDTLMSLSPDMLHSLVLSAVLNAITLFLRMLCLAKTSCILTALVPTYFIIPVRLLMGSIVSGTSLVGVITATLGLISFLAVNFTEFAQFGSVSGWVSAVIDMNQHVMADRIARAVGAIYGVALFCSLFPLVCHVLFGLSYSYVIWSCLICTIPLILINHIYIHTRKSVPAVYVCLGLLMFSFLPVQFGPITGWPALLCFALEIVVVYLVGSGLDAIQLFNGYRPGYIPFANMAAITEEEKHEADLEEAVSQFVVGDSDEDF